MALRKDIKKDLRRLGFPIRVIATKRPRAETLGLPHSGEKETRVASGIKRQLPLFSRSFAFSLQLLLAECQAVSFDSHVPVEVAVEILSRHYTAALSIIGFCQETLTDWPICPAVLVLMSNLILLFICRFPPLSHSLNPREVAEGDS